MRTELKVRAGVMLTHRAALAAHPHALPPCTLACVVAMRVTHLVTIPLIQEHVTVREELFVFGDAESADVEKTRGALP
jgi:hypothetical protein